MADVATVVRSLCTIQTSLLMTVVLYTAVGEKLGPSQPRDLKFLTRIFALLAVAEVLVALIQRARTLRPAVEALRQRPDDESALALWRTGNIISLVLAEAIALYGFVLRMLGGTLGGAAPFYAAGALLLLLWTPRLDVSEPGRGPLPPA